MQVTLELWKAEARGVGEAAAMSAVVTLVAGAKTAPEPNADQARVSWLRDSPDDMSERYCRSSCIISLPDVLSMRLTPVGAMETWSGSTSFAKMRGTCCWMLKSSSLPDCLWNCRIIQELLTRLSIMAAAYLRIRE